MSLQKMPPENSPDKSVSIVDDTVSSSLFRSQFNYWKLAWQEPEQIKGYRWMRLGGKLIGITLSLTGLAALSIVLWLWPLLPPLAWVSIALGFMLLVSQFTIYLFGRFHERTASGLSNKIAELLQALSEKDERIAPLQKRVEGLIAHLGVKNDDAKAAKRRHELEISNLKSQKKSLEHQLQNLRNQLEERDKYKLVPVIDVNHSSQVFLTHYPEYESSPPELDAPLDHYTGRVNLRLWFEHSDVKKGFMRGVELSLVRMDHAGEAKEIHLFRPTISIMDEATASEVKWNQGLVVETTTPVYWITWTFDVVGADFDAVSDDGKRFDRDCFIQFTLDAKDQPLKTDGFDVDWEEAERTGTYNITPRK